jgi:hypothetical protein
MESVYHIVTIRVNETSWAYVWRLRSRYLGTGYDSLPCSFLFRMMALLNLIEMNRLSPHDSVLLTQKLYCMLWIG